MEIKNRQISFADGINTINAGEGKAVIIGTDGIYRTRIFF
jgi:hypothetical protein